MVSGPCRIFPTCAKLRIVLARTFHVQRGSDRGRFNQLNAPDGLVLPDVVLQRGWQSDVYRLCLYVVGKDKRNDRNSW